MLDEQTQKLETTLHQEIERAEELNGPLSRQYCCRVVSRILWQLPGSIVTIRKQNKGWSNENAILRIMRNSSPIWSGSLGNFDDGYGTEFKVILQVLLRHNKIRFDTPEQEVRFMLNLWEKPISFVVI